MKLYREKSFIAAVPASIILDSDSSEDIVVQGIIDLLAVDGDSARIVDYKYSALSGKSLLDRYRKQLDIYAFVAQKLLGKKISGKTLVNLFTGDVIDFN
jgi:ATP-dependent helicase/nuclease subunit A